MVDEDVVAGKIKQTEGKVQEGAGDVTGSTEDTLAGKAKQAVGKVQEGLGHAKEAIKDSLDKNKE